MLRSYVRQQMQAIQTAHRQPAILLRLMQVQSSVAAQKLLQIAAAL